MSLQPIPCLQNDSCMREAVWGQLFVKVESAVALPFSLPIPYHCDSKSALNQQECELHTLIHTSPLEA
jgi:hypothetical protein